ncbi:hypothetical protein GCM10028781_19290 [Nostocoides australiense]
MGHKVSERGGAARDSESRRRVGILGGIGDAVERSHRLAPGAAPVGLLRLGAGVRVEDDDGVQVRPRVVVCRDPREVGVHQFALVTSPRASAAASWTIPASTTSYDISRRYPLDTEADSVCTVSTLQSGQCPH